METVRDKLVEICRIAERILDPMDHFMVVVQGPGGTQVAGCCEESNESIKETLRQPFDHEEDITHLVKGN